MKLKGLPACKRTNKEAINGGIFDHREELVDIEARPVLDAVAEMRDQASKATK